jgi:hypothetical protein
MAFTRAQATELLNKAEMQLYDDSRANGLRRLDRAALAGRVARARAARDRARDLLKRQRLAARKRGDGKSDDIAARTADKEALLVEILQRFVQARRDAPTVARKAAAGTAAAKTSTSRKAPTKKVVAKKAVATRTPAAKKAPAKKAPEGQAAARKAVVRKAATTKEAAVPKAPLRKAPVRKAPEKKDVASSIGGGDGATRNPKVSTRRALANTRKLLEAKQERDRTPQPWQSLDPAVEHVPQPGYQSPQAASKANDLHAGESRMAPIHGSMAARDRRNQGKRDHRGDDD